MTNRNFNKTLESNHRFVKQLCKDTEESINDYRSMIRLNKSADHYLHTLRGVTQPFVSPILHGRKHLNSSELAYLAKLMKSHYKE